MSVVWWPDRRVVFFSCLSRPIEFAPYGLFRPCINCFLLAWQPKMARITIFSAEVRTLEVSCYLSVCLYFCLAVWMSKILHYFFLSFCLSQSLSNSCSLSFGQRDKELMSCRKYGGFSYISPFIHPYVWEGMRGFGRTSEGLRRVWKGFLGLCLVLN